MEATLAATRRTELGKGVARKLRADGKVPAVMYGPGVEPTTLAVDPAALVEIFRKSGDRNTLIALDLEGSKIPVLVREAQRHPVTREVLHVDFFRVSKDRKVEVIVPINPVGKAKGTTEGGRVLLIRRTVRALCPYDAIPKMLDVDVSELNVGDMVKVSQIPVPEGVELVYDQDYNTLTLYGKQRDMVEVETPVAEAAAEGAEPAVVGEEKPAEGETSEKKSE